MDSTKTKVPFCTSQVPFYTSQSASLHNNNMPTKKTSYTRLVTEADITAF